MPATWYTGKVTQIIDLAPHVKSFSIYIPELDTSLFKAGQFLVFDLPVGDKRLQRWKSYSIANAPNDKNEIELCIVHFESGLGSTYFFEEVTLGTTLICKAPEGGFVLPDVIDHDLVMICTGTGIAPFRSMLRDLVNSKKDHQNIHLIFGTRRKEDVLYLEEWQQLETILPGFRFDITLSREDISAGDEFHKGYVHQVYLENYSLSRPDVHFYICGWTKMIDEAVENLFGDLKYSKEQIHYELYG
ncbi:MAG: ferredoxin--NADP reductase [Saprospiraceae bacterium]